jgi:hypothetical protein
MRNDLLMLAFERTAALALNPMPAFGFTSAANPYRCQRRNHGLCASISSCLRFAAERSLGFSGLASGTAKVRSSHSISAIVCFSVHLCHHLRRSVI